MTHATITSLPAETLSSIFGHFCLHCCHGSTEGPDSYFRSPEHHHPQQEQAHERSWYLTDYRQPLVSLCLVSKRLRDVAQQVLHHEFVLGYGDSWRSASSSWDRRLTSFLRTVGTRDDLAAAVRRVSLHPRLLEAAELGDVRAVVDLRRMGRGLGLEVADESAPPCYQERPGWTMPRPPIRPSGVVACVKPAPKTRVMYVDAYTADEVFRERYALGLELLATLVGVLPSVERLSIQQTVVDYDTPYLSGLRSMATAEGARHLKTLDLATHDFSPELMIKVPSQAAGALWLSGDTLQTLNLHMCNGFWSKPEDAPTFRSLKTLRLTQSHLSAVGLRVLLSCCTGSLTSFTYEAARTCRGMDGRQFHLPEAIESLHPHRRTLKALHLDLRGVAKSSSVQPMLPASLVDFTALEELFLSVDTLWRKDLTAVGDGVEDAALLARVLPANTTLLSVAGAGRDRRWRRLSAELLGLARAVAMDEGTLARLRQVRCDSRWKRRLDKGLGPEISSIFGAAGVEFGFDSLPSSLATVGCDDVPKAVRFGRHAYLFGDNFDKEESRIEEEERKEAEREEAERQAAEHAEADRSS